jgi:hypothetical protein
MSLPFITRLVTNFQNQIPNFLDVGDHYTAIASLNHTVIFHVEQEELRLTAKSGEKHWFVNEIAIDKIGHGRALAVGKMWREDGLHVASCFQDGMLRIPANWGAAGSFGSTYVSGSKAAFAGKSKEKSNL